MAEPMQFDLVSPERSLACCKAEAVGIPGSEGDMTVMPGHLALVTTLRPGMLSVDTGSGTEEYLVTGGFVEVTGDSTTILAEQVYRRDEITGEILDEIVSTAESALEGSEAGAKDLAETRLAAARSLREQLAR